MLFNQPNNRFMSCVVNEILLCTMNAQKRHGKKVIGSISSTCDTLDFHFHARSYVKSFNLKYLQNFVCWALKNA